MLMIFQQMTNYYLYPTIQIQILMIYLREKNKDPSINCSFIYEDKKKKKKIEYEGPVSGLKEIKKIMKA